MRRASLPSITMSVGVDGQLDFVVTVKAYPAVGVRTGEAVCVAGVAAVGDPEWVRLFPVPFRDLPEDMQFKKWQRVRVTVHRPTNDPRPESWSPNVSSFEVAGALTAGDWAERRRLVDGLLARTMCAMNRLNKLVAGRDRSAPSLAVIRTRATPTFIIEPRPQADIDAAKAKQNQGQLPLYASANEPIEVLEHAFYYGTRAWTQTAPGIGSRSSTGRSHRPTGDGAAPIRRTGRIDCNASGSMSSGRKTATPCSSSGTSTSSRTAFSCSVCSGLRTLRFSSRLDSREARLALQHGIYDARPMTRVVVRLETQNRHDTLGGQPDDVLDRGASVVRRKPTKEPASRCRRTGAEPIAVLPRVAERAEVYVVDARDFEPLAKRSLGQAALSADGVEPHVDHDGDVELLQLLDQLGGVPTLVTHRNDGSLSFARGHRLSIRARPGALRLIPTGSRAARSAR